MFEKAQAAGRSKDAALESTERHRDWHKAGTMKGLDKIPQARSLPGNRIAQRTPAATISTTIRGDHHSSSRLVSITAALYKLTSHINTGHIFVL